MKDDNGEQLKGKGREPVKTWKHPLVSQVTWRWKAGKEFVFYSKMKGVTFGLSRCHDLICILSVHSSVCINRVWGSPRVRRREGTLELHILNFSEVPRPHILYSMFIRNSSSSGEINGFFWHLFNVSQFKRILYDLEHFRQICNSEISKSMNC